MDAREDGRFRSTRWSLVQAAGRSRTPGARRALGELCEAYWPPLYAFVRRRGHDEHDARDLTQAFFERLLEKEDLRAADPERGRFRAFLLTSLRHFLANQWDAQQAKKRGGGRTSLSLDFELVERGLAPSLTDHRTPEAEFDRAWALQVLAEAARALESSYRTRGQGALFEALRPTLAGASLPYREIAERLSMNEGSVKVAAHRLRRRYRLEIEKQIEETVGSANEVQAEWQELFAAVREPRP